MATTERDAARSRDAYSSGRGYGTTASKSTTSNQNQSARQAAMAGRAMQLMGAITRNPELSKLGAIVGMGTKATDPNADLGSLGLSALGLAGYGRVAMGISAVRDALDGKLTPGKVLNTLAMFNPTTAAISIANNMFGDPLGRLGTTLSNPASMSLAADAGISVPSQSWNAVMNRQVMDQDAMNDMDAMVNSIMSRAEESDSDSRGSESGGSGGSDSSRGTNSGGPSSQGDTGRGGTGY
jgi:hypothetical protein